MNHNENKTKLGTFTVSRSRVTSHPEPNVATPWLHGPPRGGKTQDIQSNRYGQTDEDAAGYATEIYRVQSSGRRPCTCGSNCDWHFVFGFLLISPQQESNYLFLDTPLCHWWAQVRGAYHVNR